MKTLIILGVLLFVGIGLGLARFGAFAPVSPRLGTTGPLLLVYKLHKGDYKQSSAVTDEVYYRLKEKLGIETSKGFGLYFDNPKEVATADLRAALGVVIEGRPRESLPELPAGYRIAEIPESEAVIVTFPYHGTVSIVLGVLRVYPRLNAFIAAEDLQTGPIFEIYDRPGNVITYAAPTGEAGKQLQSLL